MNCEGNVVHQYVFFSLAREGVLHGEYFLNVQLKLYLNSCKVAKCHAVLSAVVLLKSVNNIRKIIFFNSLGQIVKLRKILWNVTGQGLQYKLVITISKWSYKGGIFILIRGERLG